MPVMFTCIRLAENNDFVIKCRHDLDAQVALNIVQQSSGCLYMTKLYDFAVPQFSHQLIVITIIWTLQVLFLRAYYS